MQPGCVCTADKRPLGCKLELGLDVQNPAKRCNFSDIQFSDVVRVPRPADPGPSSILQSSTFGGPLDLVKISQIRSEIRSRAKRCNFSDVQLCRGVQVPRPADIPNLV